MMNHFEEKPHLGDVVGKLNNRLAIYRWQQG